MELKRQLSNSAEQNWREIKQSEEKLAEYETNRHARRKAAKLARLSKQQT